jgi:predicted component of type VI protein secretion system
MGKLVLFLADGTMLDIPLERDRLSIGRRAGNDVCLPYPAVSGEHAAVVPVTAGAVIEDLGSTNGTFVNGKRVPRQFLHDGDRIDIGRQRFLYVADVNAVVSPAQRASADALAAAVPAVAAESWLSQPDRNGSQDAGNPAARTMPSSTPDAVATEDPPLASSATAQAFAGPILKVVTGPSAGRTLALTKDEALIGRVGLEVVAVRKVDNAYRLFAAEGAGAPRVNGVPLPPEGVLLQPDDAIEIAGARLVFLPGAGTLTS